MTLNNSALTYLSHSTHEKPAATIMLSKTTLNRIAARQVKLNDAIQQGEIRISGDRSALGQLFSMLDTFSPSFNIVTPAVLP
jgi:alkyl sulfatase BDS1-like metallo-beta-lactamase superfamily hydrolase